MFLKCFSISVLALLPFPAISADMIFLCSSKTSAEAAEAFANELSLDKFGSRLLLFEESDPASIKKVIIEVLKIITDES